MTLQNIEQYGPHFQIKVLSSLLTHKKFLVNIYDVLNKTAGVVDVKKVSIFPKTGDNYSNDTFDFDLMMSKDGTYLKAPKNVVFELKYPDLDIKGVVK